MSQESSEDGSNNSNNNLNFTQFFVGTPSNDEIKEYFLRQKRLADIKALETSPETSPELSSSFEMYLQQRKEKAKEMLKREVNGINSDSPISTKFKSLRMTEYRPSLNGPDNTMMQCNDDSFLAMEKICEKTMHLNNESAILMDLTTMDSPTMLRKSMKKASIIGDETHLNDVEAPSFMFNNSSMISPNKHSPLIETHGNRPSTILEVSETTNKTYMSSYRTALGTEASEYKTADEASFSMSRTLEEQMATNETHQLKTSNVKVSDISEDMIIKMPKIRSFYNDRTSNMTKDSLDATGQNQVTIDLTKDSLESSSGVDSSYDHINESSEAAGGDRMNDTLEQIEYMLAQAQKMQEEKNAKIIPASPMTPKTAANSPASSRFAKLKTPAQGSASKYSPMIKFSPVVKKSPANNDSAFKKPSQSTTKIPQPSFVNNKKFLHIVSPISRYIKHTPGLPLSTTARVLPGIGNNSPKHFNFRDSESFTNENESMNGDGSAYKGSSLPFRAKTKSSAVSQVYDNRDLKRTPGGKQMQGLLANTTPTVTYHQGHVKTRDTPIIFQNSLLNETAMSDQSFADISLISGDVSLQVVEGAKRMMK